MDAAGQRFDQDGPLVGHVVVDPVELRLVGPEPGRPSAPGRAAEPGLDPGFDPAVDRCGRDVGVVVAVARRGSVERELMTAGGMTQDRFEDDPLPSSSSPTTSWPGTNGKLT